MLHVDDAANRHSAWAPFSSEVLGGGLVTSRGGGRSYTSSRLLRLEERKRIKKIDDDSTSHLGVYSKPGAAGLMLVDAGG